jgi:hypothetical protein
MKFGFTPEAEILNGRLAMLGFVIAVGTYLTTGQITSGSILTSDIIAIFCGILISAMALTVLKLSNKK